MNKTISGLIPVNDLLDFDFFIPSFQRGYRWTSDQVIDLLEDILEFNKKDKTKDEFYCLQPIVVTYKDGKYYLIDGQQRLTTIYIILTYLEELMKIYGKSKFTLDYETRPDSREFLKAIDQTKKDDNIDYFHICQALETIENWFENKDGMTKSHFLTSLLNPDGNNVQFIWYQVDHNVDLIDVFTRLNMGKIALTNAELIKALFLNKENFENGLVPASAKTRQLRQIEISSDWDRIEQSLRDDELWYFIQDGSTEYDNRIEFIFDQIANNLDDHGKRKSTNKYYTFKYFSQKFEVNRNAEFVLEEWKIIKEHFQAYKDWFSNNKLYHLIGYLVATGSSIQILKKISDSKTKKSFEIELLQLIKGRIKDDFENMTYQDNKKDLRNVLLLYNVLTIISNNKSNMRFPFFLYKKENWDIEHIHSVASEMPEAAAHQFDWLKEVSKFTNDLKLKEDINEYMETKSTQRQYSFEELYNRVLQEYSESGKTEEINDLSNLALLDSGTNRGYKNAIFPIKRNTIIEKDQAGIFIPICTRNVFLKYYSKNVDQMSFWGEEDRKVYKSNLLETISTFLN